MPFAIRTDRLGKRYRLGAAPKVPYRTLRDAIMDTVRKPSLLWRAAAEPEFWALREVTLDVPTGESLGILGRNGAGKSTLLKILSRITTPSTGRAEVAGRVGSLLEVGTGFHPELTGRENAYLCGLILGMRRQDVTRHLDEIVEFAGVAPFLDTPVKKYSSGMAVRLAFAVAAHLEPETLLIDEVLAVGDAAFQQKCLGKMNQTAAQGRTVLFVSHNLPALASLCRRVVWIEAGQVVADGPAGQVIARYLENTYTPHLHRMWPERDKAPGSAEFRLHRVAIESAAVEGLITISTPIRIVIEYWNLVDDLCLDLALHIVNEQGTVVFSTMPLEETRWHGRPFPRGLYRSVCHLPGDLLNDGGHFLRLFAVKNQSTVLHTEDQVLSWQVHDDAARRGEWHGKWPGAVRPRLTWETDCIGETPTPREIAQSPLPPSDGAPTDLSSPPAPANAELSQPAGASVDQSQRAPANAERSGPAPANAERSPSSRAVQRGGL